MAAEFAGSGYGALKTAVAEAVVEFVRPLQERYAELERDPGEVGRILGAGADRAEGIAAGVLARVRDAVGLLPRGLMADDTADDDVLPDGTPARRYRRRSEELEFDRVAFFSDAVFAIAMTLLVVGIGIPHVRASKLDEALARQGQPRSSASS